MVRVNKNHGSLCVLLSSQSKQVILTFFYSLIVAYTLKIKKKTREDVINVHCTCTYILGISISNKTKYFKCSLH